MVEKAREILGKLVIRGGVVLFLVAMGLLYGWVAA